MWRKVCFVLVFLLPGCLTNPANLFKSSHQNFIDVMNDLVAKDRTIEYRMRNGPFWMDKKYLQYIENTGDNRQLYHYKQPNIFNRYCHYHFVVNKETSKIIGWGFDREKGEPEKECWISGG